MEEQLWNVRGDFRDYFWAYGVAGGKGISLISQILWPTYQCRINLDIKNLEYLLCIIVL